MTTVEKIIANIPQMPREYTKLTAAEQRAIFGKAIFGRKSIKFNGYDIYTHVRTISADYDVQRYTLEEVANLVDAGKYAEKGYKGYDFRSGRTAK